MATKTKRGIAAASMPGAAIPSLESLVGSILDQLPADALASIAGMGPRDDRERETFAGQILDLAQSLAADRVCGVEHVPNEETRQAIRDARDGKDVTRYDNLADAFADLGI